MFAYCRNTHIKQLRHSLLCTPDTLISVHNLHTILLPLNMKEQELRRAISYLELLSHKVFLRYKTSINIFIVLHHKNEVKNDISVYIFPLRLLLIFSYRLVLFLFLQYLKSGLDKMPLCMLSSEYLFRKVVQLK